MRNRFSSSPQVEFADALNQVVDLASGDVVGCELPPSATGAADLCVRIRAAQTGLRGGQLMAVHLTSSILADSVVAEGLRDASTLRDLAIVAVGDQSPQSVILLEHLRERGAQVGCDSDAPLQTIADLRPDFLWLSDLPRATEDAAAGELSTGVALVEIAQSIGGRVLASRAGVTNATAPSSAARALSALARSVDLAELAEPLPAIPVAAPLSQVVDFCLSGDDRDWLVLVDDEDHPVRVVERMALLRGEPFEHKVLAVEDNMSLDAVTHRAVARAARDRLRPLVMVGDDGRYVGLVRIEVLLAALAARRPPQ